MDRHAYGKPADILLGHGYRLLTERICYLFREGHSCCFQKATTDHERREFHDQAIYFIKNYAGFLFRWSIRDQFVSPLTYLLVEFCGRYGGGDGV